MNPTNQNPDGSGKKGGRMITATKFVIVLVILAAVGALCLPLASSPNPKARVAMAKAQISMFGTALGAYRVDCGSYPSPQEGLRALSVKPGGATNWHGPYLSGNIPVTPWAKLYDYEVPGRHNTNGYDIYAMGPDGTVYGNWPVQLTADQSISR